MLFNIIIYKGRNLIVKPYTAAVR